MPQPPPSPVPQPSSHALVPETVIAMLAQVPFFIAVIDRSDKIVWANRTPQGLTEADVLGIYGRQGQSHF